MRKIPIPRIRFNLRWLRAAFLILAAVMLATSISLYILTIGITKSSVSQSEVAKPKPPEKVKVQKPLTLEDFSSIINKEKDSVVKITGYGCGYDFFGTGFVVAPDLVATNAHVMAGMNSPQVIDSSGSHAATTVLFNPKLDFAVLRVSGLAGKPLTLNQSSSYAVNWVGSHNGDRDVVLGYPGGGSFKAGLAVISNEQATNMYGVYGNELSSRDIYTIKADVVPGNSGGPLVQHNGQVAGIVFALAPDKKNSGFAMPTTDFYGEVEQAKKLYAPVSTQECADLSPR